MEVYYRDSKMQKVCSSLRSMEKAYGKDIAMKLAQRLERLSDVDTLAELSHLPPARCHELIGDRKGQFSLDLAHPYRLIIEPADPVPRMPGGGIDRSQVTAVIVIAVLDTH